MENGSASTDHRPEREENSNDDVVRISNESVNETAKRTSKRVFLALSLWKSLAKSLGVFVQVMKAIGYNPSVSRAVAGSNNSQEAKRIERYNEEICRVKAQYFRKLNQSRKENKILQKKIQRLNNVIRAR